MRVMIIRKADAETEAEKLPSEALIRAMGDYMEEMNKAGILLGGDGLKASKHGARVKFANGRATVTDGPFAEAKELVAGYTLIEVKSLAEAVEWVKRWPKEDADGAATLEIRPLYEADDFGEAFTQDQRDREERMRADSERRAQKR